MKWYHSYETLELNTPSRQDAVDFETEARYRKEGARFIMEIGNKLGLPYLTMASGIVFFHRFYMFHSFKEFSRWVTAPTCLFLAGKVEETPKKCRDILKVTQQSLSDNRFKAFGDNPREEVMIIERILLQTIKFDLQLSHPYTYLIKFGKLLKGDMEKINEFVQKAWIFINDSLSTTLCLVYKPQVIGLAVLLLSFKLSNQNIRDFMSKPRPDWWKTFHPEAKEPELEEICEELTNMYKGKPPKRRFPDVAINKLKSSPKPPGSPQTKKLKLQLPTAGSPLAITTSVTTTSTATTTNTTGVTTTPSTTRPTATTTTASATSSSSTLPAPQSIAEIATNEASTSYAQPMQLATPTTKVSFVIHAPTPSTTATKGKPREHQNIPHPQPLPPLQPAPSYPLPPQPHKLDLASPKAQRHEQLKSFLYQQQHSPGGPPHVQSPMRPSNPVAAPLPPMQHSLQRNNSQPPLQQQSPFKATAPILDHMSSFFQSTPPSKSQQMPQPQPPQPLPPPQQPPPPRPIHQQQQQQTMQHAPAPMQQQVNQMSQHHHHHQQPNPQKSMLEQLHQMQKHKQQPQQQQQQQQPISMSQPHNPIPPSQNLLSQQPPRLPMQPNNQPQQQQQQYNAYQQQPFNSTNTMQGFQQQQPALPSFQPQMPPQMPHAQMPSGFPGQPSNFLPMPPAVSQQQQQQQQQMPFMNTALTNQMSQQNTFNFNAQQSPMMMQNRLQQQQQQPQNNMGGQLPPSFPPSNYY